MWLQENDFAGTSLLIQHSKNKCESRIWKHYCLEEIFFFFFFLNKSEYFECEFAGLLIAALIDFFFLVYFAKNNNLW